MKTARQTGRSAVTGARYGRSYPGDSEDKRAARLFIYKHAISTTRAGHAVTLAGTQPDAEVALMRDYLRWPGERTWFVDWARDPASRPAILEALRHIKRAWPKANVVRDDINNIVDDLPLVGFANLDFMGFSRESVMPCVKKTLQRLAPRGVMSLTWFRGREVDSPERSAWDVMEAARDIEDISFRRWVGVQRLIFGWAADLEVPVTWIGGLDYQHNHSPMSVTIFQRAP